VLVVDDDREMCELAEAGLSECGYAVHWRQSPHEALRLIDDEQFAVMLADIHMDELNGLELCRNALAKRPDLVVVMMTGFGSLEHAVGAMRAGAYDFVTKPVSIEALALVLGRAARHQALTEELRRLRESARKRELPDVVGASEPMRRVADLIGRVASTDTAVLVTGESGTGKELVARALHEQSPRTGPFLAVNCAALPEPLLESELFGHARGAFTDARSPRAGLFEEANGGTLFLDEIGEMPRSIQVKILRALQEHRVRPLGSTREVEFDARIVTATNRDLDDDVAAGRFREDLYYRINVVRLHVPPLRVRGNDVLLLAQHFLERAAQKTSKPVSRMGRLVAEHLGNYPWPGNVRELENCMERMVALAAFDVVRVEDMPAKVRDYRPDEVHAIGVLLTLAIPMSGGVLVALLSVWLIEGAILVVLARHAPLADRLGGATLRLLPPRDDGL
jgi:two-component system response regulator HydG